MLISIFTPGPICNKEYNCSVDDVIDHAVKASESSFNALPLSDHEHLHCFACQSPMMVALLIPNKALELLVVLFTGGWFRDFCRVVRGS
jgi:hypothetical protein